MQSFESFGAETWAEWLEGVLAGAPISPSAPQSNREISQDLLALYRTLSVPSALAFATAVGDLLRATTLSQNFAPRLFTLLQLVATVKPRGLDHYLNWILRGEVCRQQKLEYGNGEIHSDVLSALSRYGPDEKLVDYIERSVSEGASFAYTLNGFRIAGLLTAAAAGRIAPYVTELILQEDTEIRLRGLAVQLLDLAFRHQYQAFLEFFLDFSERQSAAHVEAMARAILLSGCTEESTRSDKMRALQSVIADCASAVVQRLPLKRVLAIAQSHRSVEKKIVQRSLDHCWRSSTGFTHGPVPWEYVPSDEDFAPSRLMKNKDILFNTENDHVEFDGSRDPVVIDLLNATSRRRGAEVRELVAI